MIVTLVGPAGAGKSTVGKALAERMKTPFFDTDSMIEKEAGQSIAKIFATAGEPAFREMERKMVALLTLLPRGVVATGGGLPVDEENRRQLSLAGPVVYLRCAVPTLLARLAHGVAQRPLLQGDSTAAVERLLQERREAYEDAKYVIDTDELTALQVVDEIVRRVGRP